MGSIEHLSECKIKNDILMEQSNNKGTYHIIRNVKKTFFNNNDTKYV